MIFLQKLGSHLCGCMGKTMSMWVW